MPFSIKKWTPLRLLRRYSAIWIEVDLEVQDCPLVLRCDSKLKDRPLPFLAVADPLREVILYVIRFAGKASPYMSNHKYRVALPRYEHAPVPISDSLWDHISFALSFAANERFEGRSLRSFPKKGFRRNCFQVRLNHGGVDTPISNGPFKRGMRIAVSPEDKWLLQRLREEEIKGEHWQSQIIWNAVTLNKRLKGWPPRKRQASFDMLANVFIGNPRFQQPAVLYETFRRVRKSRLFEEFLEERLPLAHRRLLAFRRSAKEGKARRYPLSLVERRSLENECKIFDIFPYESRVVFPRWKNGEFFIQAVNE